MASFVLPQKMIITGGSIDVARFADAPNFALSLLRMSFLDEPARRLSIAQRVDEQ